MSRSRIGTAIAVFVAGIATVPGAAAAADHDVLLVETTEVEAGGQGTLSLTVAPAAGHRISKDAPLLITLSTVDSAVATVPKRRYRWRDVADAQATAPRFDLSVTGKAAGQSELVVTLQFWVCAKKTCRPVRSERRVQVAVVAPPPDAGPPGPDGNLGPDAGPAATPPR